MSTLAESLIASSSRPVRLRARPDIETARHCYQGRQYCVVKEPLSLQYYRLQEEEYAVLQLLDGQRSLADIQRTFNTHFAPQQIELKELQQFIGMLHRSGLVISDLPGQGKQLVRRGRKQRLKRRLSSLANVLALQARGINPDRLLDRLIPWTSWFFSKAMVATNVLLAFCALALVVVQWSTFRARLPAFQEFFGAHNWLLLGAVLASVKIAHEFGHGLTCKRFGRSCHELGIMLLVLTPCLYCNVSDSWMLSSKWKRAAIAAAGMYVELVIATWATFFWWFSQPGPLNHVCLQLILVCSVSTLLFNGNPLLRFDGYYILADLVEMPNLRQKSNQVFIRIARRWCLGIEDTPDPFLPRRNRWLFAMYTAAAMVYRWVVLFAILMFLSKVFEPYGLKSVGRLIALLAVVSLVAMPAWKLYRFARTPGIVDQVKKKNLWGTLLVGGGLVCIIFLLPFPAYVRCGMYIDPVDATNIYAESEGMLGSSVQAGQHVEPNALLARIEAPSLDLEIARLESEREVYLAQYEVLLRLSMTDEDLGRDLLHLRETLDGAEAQLQELRRLRHRLELRAPHAGIVIPPPPQHGDMSSSRSLPVRSGTLLERRNQGAPVRAGELVCRIGQPGQFQAVLVIPESDIEFIRIDKQGEGPSVRCRLNAFSGETLTGHVYAISEHPISLGPDGFPRSESETAEANTIHPESGEIAYLVFVRLDQPNPQWQSGLRGKGKIAIGRRTLAARLSRFLARTFQVF